VLDSTPDGKRCAEVFRKGTRRGSAREEGRTITSRAWAIIATIFILSVPLWIAGGLTHATLLPGLPVSSLMFLCPALAACLDAHRRAGSAGVRQLLAGAVDVRRIPPGSGRILSLFLMPAVLAAAYGIMAAT